MTTFGDPLDPALRTLALALAEAFDLGWAPRNVLRTLTSCAPDPTDHSDIVTDLVLSASALLAGVTPDLPGLIDIWGIPRLVETARTTTTKVLDLVKPG